jgi:putative GTP pyrophosphokinase
LAEASDITTDFWTSKYREVRQQYVAFTNALHRELEMLFDGGTVSVAQLEARTKTVDSFSEKIDRKGKYTDPLREITDLSGLRVIVHNSHDISGVGELVDSQFEIDDENSGSRGADIEPDRFGYRAEHYVIRLRPEQAALTSWSKFKGYTAEVQVRTVMQHAWAAVDHRMRYKGSDLPGVLERRLFRLNALLELADEEFAALQLNSTKLSESYARSMAHGDLSMDLDALSLSAYLARSQVDRHWADIALGLGYSRPTADRMDAAAVLETIRAAGIPSLAELQEVLDSAEQWGTAALTRILELTRDGSSPDDRFATIVAYRDDILRLLVLFNARSQSAIEASYFRIDIQEALLQATSA